MEKISRSMIEYRKAVAGDIEACAKIYAEGFAAQLRLFFGPRPPVGLLADFLRLCRRFENDGFIVGHENNRPAGFILITKNHGRLFRRVIAAGIVTATAKSLFSVYGRMPLFRILASTAEGVTFFRKTSKFEKKANSSAQVVTMNVNSRFHGQGIGGKLLYFGIEYLKKHDVPALKLEVRTDNTPALHLYEKTGFVTCGEIKSSVGTSLVMVKRL